MKTYTFILVAAAIIASTGVEAKTAKLSTGVLTEEPTKDVYAYALKKFNAAHPSAVNVNWINSADDYTAVFRSGSVTNIWVYFKKSGFNYTIRRYAGSELDTAVKARIAGAFEEYTITSVDEVHVQDNMAYLVRMESSKFRKLLRVNADEMSVVKSEAK